MDKSDPKRKAEATLIPTKKATKTKSIAVVQEAKNVKKVGAATKPAPKTRPMTKPYTRSTAKPVRSLAKKTK